MTRSYGDATTFEFDKMSHERTQQAIQDQALLEGRIMNAKSPVALRGSPTSPSFFRAAVGDKRTSDAPLPSPLPDL